MLSNNEARNRPEEKEDQLPGHRRARLPKTAIKKAIESILSVDREITKQTSLLHELEKKGFNMSTASLSRILKTMGIKKNDKGYLTLDPAREKAAKIQELSAMLERHAINTVSPAGFVVLQTTPGFAHAIGVLARRAYPEEIIGTIAGDDTVLFILSRQGIDEHIHELLNYIVRRGKLEND